jgi:uncharacterized protein (DUF3084 family)
VKIIATALTFFSRELGHLRDDVMTACCVDTGQLKQRKCEREYIHREAKTLRTSRQESEETAAEIRAKDLIAESEAWRVYRYLPDCVKESSRPELESPP